MEILGVNIQCCSLSKHEMEISQNALASIIEKFTKERKNALIKLLAYNFWNVSNGMVCTVLFSNHFSRFPMRMVSAQENQFFQSWQANLQ